MREPRRQRFATSGAWLDRPLLALLITMLFVGCGRESGNGLRGCAPGHDAAGTYRFAPAYLDERLRLLEDSLRIEERPYDREALVEVVAQMRTAWASAVLVLARDGRFDLSGVDHPRVPARLRGTWEVRLDGQACRLLLKGPGDTLGALLGEDWVIPWFEEPQPGIVLDVQLVRMPEGG